MKRKREKNEDSGLKLEGWSRENDDEPLCSARTKESRVSSADDRYGRAMQQHEVL